MNFKPKSRSHFITLKKNLMGSHGILDKAVKSIPLENNYKIFLLGRSGCGKSFFTSWLAGHSPLFSYYSTFGTTVTTLSCLCQIKLQIESLINFTLELWESGSNSKRTNGDLISDCPQNVDSVIIFFSYGEKETFLSIPNLMEEAIRFLGNDKICFLALGNFWNLDEHCAVTEFDVLEFETKWKVPVIKFPLLSSRDLPSWTDDPYWEEKRDAILLLILEQLYLRDEVLGLNSSIKSKKYSSIKS